jgi:hypothetical protein
MACSKVRIFELIFLAVLIVGIVLFSLAFSEVPANCVGILQSVYSKEVDAAAIYSPGIYHVGISNKFLTYPLHFQTLVYSSTNSTFHMNQQTNVVSNTLDGTQISFSALIYYTYIPEMLTLLHAQYPDVDQHTQVIAKTAKTIMAAVINRYRYADLLNNRAGFQAAMSYSVAVQFMQNFYVKFQLLLITDILLETIHEQALVTTFVLRQGELSSEANNTINTIQARINLLTAQTNNIIASNVQAAGIQSAAQQGGYLLEAENLKVTATQGPLTQLRNLYGNDQEYIRCLQMVNLFLSDDTSIVWNSDFIA